MKYTSNTGMLGNVVAIPREIIDKYICDSNGAQIKVLLWIFINTGRSFDASNIAKELSISEREAQSALEYWAERIDFISSSDKTDSTVKATKKAVDNTLNHEIFVTRYKRPGIAYVAQRVGQSDDIGFLMQEAQNILGRPISGGDSGTLLMLHDNDGLPVEVIVMLLQYAAGVGKTGMKYIQKTGASWATEGIDTVEKADKKIHNLSETSKAWKNFVHIIGIDGRAPTTKEEEAVYRWFCDWRVTDDLIKEAYDRCVNANGKYILGYIDSIIKRWHKQGVVTIGEAMAEKFRPERKIRSTAENSGASYNIEEYENYNIFEQTTK